MLALLHIGQVAPFHLLNVSDDLHVQHTVLIGSSSLSLYSPTGILLKFLHSLQYRGSITKRNPLSLPCEQVAVNPQEEHLKLYFSPIL